jgi:hypothetical protein
MANHKKRRLLLLIVLAIVLIFFVLMIPDTPGSGQISGAAEKPFAWNMDEVWHGLEEHFRLGRMEGSTVLDARLLKLRSAAEAELIGLSEKQAEPEAPVFTSLLNKFFEMAPIIAVRPCYASWYMDYYSRLRTAMKMQSRHWNMNSKAARNTLYKVLYGMRAAMEEVLLQLPGMKFDPAMFVQVEPSATPPAKIFGITVHSGDLLVSRGGAVASALISRGNDYPGNFSHVALIFVDEKSAVPYLVEAHIERGVAVSSLAQYVADKKLRFMVMRPRTDLPRLVQDPMVPHKAAAFMYHEALSRHVPYDFKMNFHEPSAMFCSEVGSLAYQHEGIQLWRAVSTISSPGVVRLLSEFGVENFVTQMPADLEYDPQLSVVAEWRDPQTLFKDHIYNAVMDVMIEDAQKGSEIGFNRLMLPVARVVKGYSFLLNMLGYVGPIPEGMSATQALKHNAFTEMHTMILGRTEAKVKQFISGNGYVPPYWKLIEMARASIPEQGTR